MSASADTLDGTFSSERTAKQAYRKFLEANRGDRGKPEPETPGTTPSDVWSGGLDAPSNVANGDAFSADATVRNTTKEAKSSRFVLALYGSGGLEAAIAAQSQSVPGKSQVAFTYQVPTGGLSVQPGDYTLAVVATGTGAGVVAKSPLTVKSGGSNDGQSGEWGKVEVVRELPEGWYLLVQQHTQKDKQRFMVAGKKKDGTRVYLRPNGQVSRGEPVFFDSAQAAAEAFRKWLQRNQSGETDGSKSPSPSAPRPDPSKVKKDAKKASGGGSGLVGTVVGTATNNPAAVLGVLIIAYYGYKKTQGADPLKDAKQQLSSLVNGGGS